MTDADMQNTNLSGTNFAESILVDVDFIDSNLQNALGGPFVGCTDHPLCI